MVFAKLAHRKEEVSFVGNILSIFFILGTPLRDLLQRLSFIKIGDEKYILIRPADAFVYQIASGIVTLCVFSIAVSIWVMDGFVAAAVLFIIGIVLSVFYIRFACKLFLDILLRKTLEQMAIDNKSEQKKP